MISVCIEGRLGNQLFQYAFIYSNAKRIKTKFYLDKSVDYFLLDKYFEIDNDFCYFFDKYVFSIKGYKNIFSHHFRYLFYRVLKCLFSLKEINFSNSKSPSSQIELIKNNIIYKGFFQSENYFKESKAYIFGLFKIKSVYKTAFRKILKNSEIPNKYIVIHIRKGDYKDYNFNLEINYYHKAIQSIHKNENYYVFISDEPNIIQDEFGYLNNIYISFNEEIIDFQFLTNATICILANSSFSWWGAYLNSNNPIVIAPKFWLGINEKKEYPINIIPYHWRKL